MSKTRIGLLGYSGRMGQAIAREIALSDDCVLSAAYVQELKPEYKKTTDILISANIDDVMKACDVIIDFTLADSTPVHAENAAKHGKAYVAGATGLKPDELAYLKQASSQIPVLYAPNTSLSLAAMKQITQLAAKLLGRFDYDVAIIDEHHRMKQDAPSGTAVALGEAVMHGNAGAKEPSYAAIRAGHIVGNHEVIFTGNGETIRLHHSVTDRQIFARGAVQAALWLHQKPKGFYGMDDVLGMKN